VGDEAMSEIALSEYIESLRQELLRAMEQSSKSELRFLIDKIDLEIDVVVEASSAAKASAKFSFWVVDASAKADAKLRKKNSQRIKLTLAPKYKDDIPPFISKEDSPAVR
jgi:hypothetical protein